MFLESHNEYKAIFSSHFSPSSLRSPETEKQDPIAKLEAERKLQELKRRRNETDSEVLEKMKQKQQMAEAELEQLKKKREERKKILEEEEKQKKQQLAEKKAKEEVKKRYKYDFNLRTNSTYSTALLVGKYVLLSICSEYLIIGLSEVPT